MRFYLIIIFAHIPHESGGACVGERGEENNALHNAPNVRPTKELVVANRIWSRINTRKDKNPLLRLGQHVCGSGEGSFPLRTENFGVKSDFFLRERRRGVLDSSHERLNKEEESIFFFFFTIKYSLPPSTPPPPRVESAGEHKLRKVRRIFPQKENPSPSTCELTFSCTCNHFKVAFVDSHDCFTHPCGGAAFFSKKKKKMSCVY